MTDWLTEIRHFSKSGSPLQRIGIKAQDLKPLEYHFYFEFIPTPKTRFSVEFYSFIYKTRTAMI